MAGWRGGGWGDPFAHRYRGKGQHWYVLCMSEQLAVRIPSELVRELDAAVQRGEYGSRAEAVRSAIAMLVETDRRNRVGDAIVEGYRQTPQTDEEVVQATRAAIASIEEEPW